MSVERFRVGVDIGGTFTDFTVLDTEGGAIQVAKRLTTPQAPERAVLGGLDDLAARVPDLMSRAGDLVHATTLATNVVIERKGAPTGLLATEGFRDILEIGREVRYDIYDLFIEFPQPLIDRPLRLGVAERMLADGTVLTPLDEAAVRAAARTFAKAGVGSVAVSFLHAYRNPAHELRARAILAEELPGIPVSLSHEVHPEPKEYERTSTTAVDAYVKPVIDAYLNRLKAGLEERGHRRGLSMMQSNGGAISVEVARHKPVLIVESGPAAGVEAACFYGRMLGLANVLSFDMGGTTAKLCLIEDGRATRTRGFEVDRVSRFRPGSGIPVAIPVYDLLEIGAGGGSIASVGDLGLLRIGPRSAGADPGPACYGRGGREPTVTDADLILGRLDPGYFLGGEMALDTKAAAGAVERRVAKETGLTVQEAAHGIVDLVDETMASAARVYLAEKGRDASELTLIAFGGAGPLHAVSLARKLGCPRVVVPPMPGVMSSFGLLTSPLAFETTLPVRELLDELDAARLEERRADAEARVAGTLPAGRSPRFRCVAEIWHLSQDYPLEVDIDGSFAEAAVIARARADFRAAYQGLYGRTDDDNPLELVALRIQAIVEAAPVELAPLETGAGAAARTRPLYDPAEGRPVEARIHARAALAPGVEIDGPAIIEERESTTVIGPRDRLRVDRYGFLIVSVAPGDAQDAGVRS